MGRDSFIPACRMAALGALAAGLFGILHDQITFTISPEYFTRMKFGQFAGTDLGLPPRLRVALIGFLGSWWLGLIGGWFLARIAQARFRSPGRRITHAAAAILGMAALGGGAGGWLGPGWLENRSGWSEALQAMGVTDAAAFRQVAGVHLGTYLGALAGLAGWLIKWSVAGKDSAGSA